MARFRGTVSAGRGVASRLGHAKQGLTTEAQSYSGKVVVHLYDHNGEDYARIRLEPHKGTGTVRVLYDGPVSGGKQLALPIAS
jgi:ribosomal protein L35AE/L33A